MLPIAPPTIMPKAIRTVSERAAASRKLNQKSTSTTIAIAISSTALLPKSPNAPCTLCSNVQFRKFGIMTRHGPSALAHAWRIQCFEAWSAQSTRTATIATTSVLTTLEFWLRYKLIEPSCDVEECIVDENQSDDDKECARTELDRS